MKFSPYLYTIKQQQKNISIMTMEQANTRANELTAHIEDRKARNAFGDVAAFLFYKGMTEEAVIKSLEVMHYWTYEA